MKVNSKKNKKRMREEETNKQKISKKVKKNPKTIVDSITKKQVWEKEFKGNGELSSDQDIKEPNSKGTINNEKLYSEEESNNEEPIWQEELSSEKVNKIDFNSEEESSNEDERNIDAEQLNSEEEEPNSEEEEVPNGEVEEELNSEVEKELNSEVEKEINSEEEEEINSEEEEETNSEVEEESNSEIEEEPNSEIEEEPNSEIEEEPNSEVEEEPNSEVEEENSEEEEHNSEVEEESSNEEESNNEDEEEPNSEEEFRTNEDLNSEGETNNEDPFFLHFNGNLPKDKEPLLENQENWKPKFLNWPHLGRLSCRLPEIDQTIVRKEKKLLDDDEEIFLPKIGTLPDTPSKKAFDAITNGFAHKKLIKNIKPKSFSGEQSEIFTLLSNYLDFLHSEATHGKWDKIRRVCAIHCLNHILKARDQILKHNDIVQKYEKKREFPPRLEDQGWTRPRILILQPFRNSAYKLIKELIALLNIEVMNKKSFENYYGPPEEKDVNKSKPEDFQKVFAGDIDDNFIIGVALGKKALKLETSLKIRELLKCDIIIASPLCLRRMLEADDNIKPSKGCKEDKKSSGIKKTVYKTVYMLSSIEIFIVDQADVIFMQNWESVTIIEKALNNRPNELEGLNIELYRMHLWYFEEQARFFRQNILFSSTTSDFIRGIISRSRNVAGKVELRNSTDGVLHEIKLRANFTMLRVKKSDSNMSDFDGTFNYFTKEFLPRLTRNNYSHVLIYIPDYFDYVRLNHFFHKDGGISFATINEYMIEENSKVAKARSLFFEGKKKFLLYTERFHFYRRYRIKGVRHIVFYTPPLYPHFLKEVCEFLSEEYQNPKEKFNSLSYIYLLYHLSDVLKLNDLIGTKNTREINKSEKFFHTYLTGP